MRSSECPKIGIGRLNISTRLGFFVSGFQDRSPDLRISRDSRIQRFHGCVFSRRWRVLERPRWCHIRQEVSDSHPIEPINLSLGGVCLAPRHLVSSAVNWKKEWYFLGFRLELVFVYEGQKQGKMVKWWNGEMVKWGGVSPGSPGGVDRGPDNFLMYTIAILYLAWRSETNKLFYVLHLTNIS